LNHSDNSKVTIPSAKTKPASLLVTFLPWLAVAAAPLFFSTNLVFGRSLANEMNPFTLAFIRWLCVALLLTPFVVREWASVKSLLQARKRLLLTLGFLGMWIAGAIVYLALHYTTAINGTLIYTTSPIFILLIEAAFFKRRIGAREIFGALLAFFGVAIIVLKDDISALSTFSFNPGDMLIALAAVAWAAYSVLYRDASLRAVSNLALFGLVAWAGTLILFPALPILAVMGQLEAPPLDAISRIIGLVFLSSLAAFGLYQFGVRALGPSLTGIFMYLLPAYGVLLAVLVLGEPFEGFHLIGIATVIFGVVLATFPAELARGFLRKS
jgi:drug/metabolite transporter (DMT)-like permease